MIPGLPFYISLIFGLTTVTVALLFSWAVNNASSAAIRKNAVRIFLVTLAWLGIQAILTLKGVYNSDPAAMPPKIVVFGVLPMILLIIVLFITRKGRAFIDSLPLKQLTYLHVIRIPVELVLLWLYLQKAVPQLMTFEGRNFDILAGITAPFIAYYGLTKGKLGRRGILAWNGICLALLLNIVINALLSANTPFQQFAFDQPNIAIVYFPFSWLPAYVVPVVLFSHLVSIRQLIKSA